MGCECLYCHCSVKPATADTSSKDWCQGFCRTCGTGCAQYSEEIFQLGKENARLREALEFYAQGDKTKTLSGEERYLQLVANEMDISKVDGQWKTGKRAREALKEE